MSEAKPITTLGYLGGMLLSYVLAFVLLFLVYLVPLIWGGGQLMDKILNIPILNIVGGLLTVIAVPLCALMAAAVSGFLFIPHALVMLLWLGLRQRGPWIRTPITEMLLSGAMAYGFAFVVTNADRGADAWVWYGLIAGCA